MTHESESPCNGKLLQTCAERSSARLEEAPATTAGSFEAWWATTLAERPRSYKQPFVPAGIAWNNPALDKEVFGPFAVSFRVADEDAAVALAKFTAGVARGKRIAVTGDAAGTHFSQGL